MDVAYTQHVSNASYLGMNSGSLVICGNPHNKSKGKTKTKQNKNKKQTNKKQRKNSEGTRQCVA